ncbi:MAG: Uma2 family endonuclease [Gemmataceae bacterium]
MTIAHFVNEGEHVRVPVWVTDLETFRRWTDDADFPEHSRFFLGSELEVDMNKELLFTHNEVKSEINTVLRTLANARRLGRYFHDGVFWSNVEANVAVQPDGLFVSTEARRDNRVRLIEGRYQGYIKGSPDMVLEVVSRSSVDKDTVLLRDAYARAGVREYWLVDARVTPLRFDLL